jgi:hypothetical protein
MVFAAVILATIALFAIVVALVEITARKGRARRHAEWHRRYYHEGGLIRSLIARWSNPRKLEYRPDDKRDGEP